MKSLGRFLLFLFLVLVVLAGFVFTLKNSHAVELWLIWDFAPRPLSLWIIAAFMTGGLSGLLLGFGLWRNVRNRIRVHQLETQLRKNEKIIADLRRQADSGEESRKG